MYHRHRNGSRQTAVSSWKKRLAGTLLDQAVIQEKYTGKVLLYFHNGNLVLIERTVTLK
jgi:hypothetical protein